MGYLDNLNTSQRAAVTAPLGPVSVLAGPGSGKTRVLTHRIQHLFYTHNFAPPRIRAVTFTQNGTQTMRERLDSDGVKGVRISTFHSLCRAIIDDHFQRNPELGALCEAAGVVMPFCWHSWQPKEKQPLLKWYKADGRLTPDVALWVAFQYACVAFSQRMHPELDFTAAGYQRVDTAFQDIKPELCPVHGFVDVGMPELLLLGNYEGLCRFRDYVLKAFGYRLQVADDLHPDYLHMVSKFSRGDRRLQTLFIDAYHQLVRRYAFLDFTAQTLWAHRILLSSPEALQALQHRYDVLLIDEFQDTDPVQFRHRPTHGRQTPEHIRRRGPQPSNLWVSGRRCLGIWVGFVRRSQISGRSCSTRTTGRPLKSWRSLVRLLRSIRTPVTSSRPQSSPAVPPLKPKNS